MPYHFIKILAFFYLKKIKQQIASFLIISLADVTRRIIIKWRNKYWKIDAESIQNNSMPI